MSNTKTLFVVIPTYGEFSLTKRCIEALLNSTYKNLVIVIVNHGETDNEVNSLGKLAPNINYLRGDTSLWWTGAINIGIKYAIKKGAELIMLINDDCSVMPHTIETLISRIDSLSKPSIIAPTQKFLNRSKRILRAMSCFSLGFPTLIMPGFLSHPSHNDNLIKTSLIIGGRGVIVPTSLFKTTGLFDEADLPHYGADHDFYIRCRKNGVPLYICPESIVIVDSDSTSTADSPGHLSLTEFIATLQSRKSHRNIPDLMALYKKHYPIRPLYFLGVGLNLLRYLFIYMYKRLGYLLVNKSS